MPALSAALQTFEATEANLQKLESLWDQIYAMVPKGPSFGSPPDYEELCRAFKRILPAMPAIDGLRVEDLLYEYDDAGRMQLDAAEVGEFEAQLSVATDEALNTGQGAGYVLDFSDRTFTLFFDEEFGIDIDQEKYRANGTSKGKRLREFLTIVDGATASRVLRTLWDHRAAVLARRGSDDDPAISDRYFQIVHRLQGDPSLPNADGIERFAESETLDELVAAIQRDIGVNKPQAALDRLHTYCMKKFAHLIATRGGGACEKEEPLHSRVGRYVKQLEAGRELQPISVRIIKNSISIFEAFNSIRNDHSLAHDNELIGLHEARLSSIPSAAFFVSCAR
jgi:hypothetical protein